MSIPIREALTRCVAEDIISYIQENQISPFDYLCEIAVVAEITDADEHIKDGIAQHEGIIMAVMHPDPTEEDVWKMIGTIRLRHHFEWPQLITDRPKELRYFLELVKKEYCHRCGHETFRKKGKNGRCCAECGTYDWHQKELSERNKRPWRHAQA